MTLHELHERLAFSSLGLRLTQFDLWLRYTLCRLVGHDEHQVGEHRWLCHRCWRTRGEMTAAEMAEAKARIDAILRAHGYR